MKVDIRKKKRENRKPKKKIFCKQFFVCKSVKISFNMYEKKSKKVTSKYTKTYLTI